MLQIKAEKRSELIFGFVVDYRDVFAVTKCTIGSFIIKLLKFRVQINFNFVMILE